MAEEMKIARTT